MIACSRPITRRLEFDAGHRVLGHEGKCACLHGHRYVAEITCVAKQLDGLGRVIDFSAVKNIIGGWIDKNWDHNMILHQDDPLAKLIGAGFAVNFGIQRVPVGSIFGPKAPYIMPGGRNTTAEELAYELYTVCISHLPVEIDTQMIRIYETPNCWADFIPDNSPVPNI